MVEPRSEHSIYLCADFVRGGIIAHGKISGNMMDGSGRYSIQLESASATYPSFIDIFGNTGCGYGMEQGFLRAKDTGRGPLSAAYLNVFGNTMQFYYRTAFVFENVRGVKLATDGKVIFMPP
jgi:hypothetical protein